jgi:hypothetical protein
MKIIKAMDAVSTKWSSHEPKLRPVESGHAASARVSQRLVSRCAGQPRSGVSRRVWLGRAFLLGALLYAGGCSSDSDIGRVEGTVTMDGQPLPKATVVFIQGQGRPAGGITDDRGRYVLNYAQGRQGAVPGLSRVRITTAQGPSETADGIPVPAVAERIPSQFNSESTLQFEVVAGELNLANFDLLSKGKIVPSDGS